MVTPQWKVEINDIDVSEWVVGEGKFNTSTTDVVGSGFFFLDFNIPYTISAFDEVKFSLSISSYVHIITHLIINKTEEDANSRIRIDTANTSYRYLKKTATNKFRQDSATGNGTYIVKALNDEYTPEISYQDGTTIPSTTFQFTEQAYQNKYINEVYDHIADLLDRSWWVDKDKLLHFKTRTFDLVTTSLTEANVIGNLAIDNDTSKLANYVTVDGAKLLKNVTQAITVTGATDYDLTYVPGSTITVKDGTYEQSVALEGSENFSDGTYYDCYIKKADKKLTFNNLPSAGTVNVTYGIYNMIHDELQDGASITSQDITVEKVIVNENITTQAHANELGQNYLDNYKLPLDLISGNVHITSQSQITDWQVGKRVPINYTDKKGRIINDNYNLIAVDYNFGTKGVRLKLRFTDKKETNNDLLKQLILKVKQREEKEREARENIVKYFFWGGNIYLEVENVSIRKTEKIDGKTLIWNHSVQGKWAGGTYTKYDWGPRTFSGTETEMVVINSSKGFKDRYERDEWFKDSGSTDAVYHTGSQGYVFQTGSTYYSKFIEKAGNTYTNALTSFTADHSTNNWIVRVYSSQSGTYETIGSTATSITSGTDFKYQVEYTGGTANAKFQEILIKFSS